MIYSPWIGNLVLGERLADFKDLAVLVKGNDQQSVIRVGMDFLYSH